MAKKYIRQSGSLIDGKPFFELAKNLQKYYEDELEEAGKLSEDEAKQFIDNAGTGRSWAAPWNGRWASSPGRVESGNMRNDIKYRIIRGQNAGLDVGWLDTWQEYYKAQELGFSAGGARPAQVVQGMNLFGHLRGFVRDRVQEAVARGTDKALNDVF